MAYTRKLANGNYRCEVERNGVRDSAVRETKSAAVQWGVEREAEILQLKRGGYPNKTFAQALEKYRDEESPKKGGAHWEETRINAMLRDFKKLCATPLIDLTTKDFADWRDARLKKVTTRGNKVTAGTVQRDVNLLSNVFTLARTEWKFMGESPLVGFRAPGQNPARKRIVQPREVRRIVRWLGYRTAQVPQTKQAQTALAYLIAHRTGMRAGEVLQLNESIVDVVARKVAVHHKTEFRTGEKRVVPLSRRALRLCTLIPPGGFTVTSASLDALFRKARKGCLVSGTTFHDSRASALTRFSKKVDVMTLAKISGHKDLDLLLSTYFRTEPSEIAAQLD